MARSKITIMGAGNVGREAAVWCAVKELGDIVLWNRTKATALGSAYDIMEAAPIIGFDAEVKGTNNIKDTKKSDVIVFTAGVPRKAGQTREQLVTTNAQVIYPLVKKVARLSPHAIIIMVTNPLDAMTYLAYKASNFPSSRVLGLAGVLDSSRFSSFVAKALKVSVKEVEALTLGSHGESMVPLSRFATVIGIPVSDLLSAKKLKKIEEHTKKAGEEIVRLLGTNASISTGAVAAKMVEAIIHNEKSLLPCSAYLHGQYGIHDLYLGVPIILGAQGVEQIIELKLTATEHTKFQKAAASIRQLTLLAKKAIHKT
ncbi:malate dehydrogenase [Candidatus Woesearchaeota archaeon]|nr:malate dehydrogenase [Candidatus Woesearchaeota archaeon]